MGVRILPVRSPPIINQFALNIVAEFRNFRQTTSLPWKSEAKTILTKANAVFPSDSMFSIFQVAHSVSVVRLVALDFFNLVVPQL